MATNILTNARLFVAQYNLSGDMNAIKLVTGAMTRPDTVFGASYDTVKGGGALIKTELSGSGFVQSSSTGVEDVLTGKVGVDQTLITVAGEGGDVGESCRFFCGGFDSYDAGAKIGDMHQFNYTAKNSRLATANPLVRGYIMEDGKTSRTTALNGATQLLGATSATQKVYAGLHLTAFSGTDVTFTLKSAVTDWGTPTTRFTFTTNSAVGSEYLTPISGAITDTFWRIEATGTFTSFSAVLVAGIQ